MKTSVIRHPENSQFIIRRGWIIKALNEDRPVGYKKDELSETGAELISVFEYHFNNRWANELLRSEVAKQMRRTKLPPHETGDWMPYTVDYLRELLLNGRGTHAIKNSLPVLIEKQFISIDVPADIQGAFNRRLSWIKLEVDALNAWVENNCEKSWMTDWELKRPIRNIEDRLPEPVVVVETQEVVTGVNGLKTLSAKVDSVCAFHRYIAAKNKNYVYDSERKTKVGTRISKENRSLGQCAQVIIGNRLSEHHQGQNDRQTIYDDIELIFRSAKKFELHLNLAESNGVTEQIAYGEFEAFLSGKTSKYAKRQVKDGLMAVEEQTEAPVRPTVTDEEMKRYRNFARNVVAFFLTNVSNKEIIEMCNGNASLSTAGSGLVDGHALTDCLIDASKTFRPNGIPTDIVTAIESFSMLYAKLQRANS